MSIDKNASVHPGANIHKDAVICAFAVIGDSVKIGANTIVESHAVIQGPTTIGKDNHIYSFASVGGDPQDVSYQDGQKSLLEIGDNNLIREFCTINRGTEKEPAALTKIGSNNMLMAYVHIAHDCILGNHIIMANNSSLAGHVRINDYAFLGGFTLIKQFCLVGESVYTSMGSLINKDIPPYLIVSGDKRARVRSVNIRGIAKRGFSPQTIDSIKAAFKKVYRDTEGRIIDRLLIELESSPSYCAEVGHFIRFIRTSKNGIVRGSSEED